MKCYCIIEILGLYLFGELEKINPYHPKEYLR